MSALVNDSLTDAAAATGAAVGAATTLIVPPSLGVPLGGVPGIGHNVNGNIVFLAFYNLLFIGILARFFASSTSLAYTWRPALFAFLRIFVFALRIWLDVHGVAKGGKTSSKHMFIAQALLLAAAPMVLLSASLMLVRNAARAYKPARRDNSALGVARRRRSTALRIVTYILDFGLLCMAIIFFQAAIGYTDALSGSADDIRRLRNIWRATSAYGVILVLIVCMMVAVLAIKYSQGALNRDRVAEPNKEPRKLLQLTFLNILLFIVSMYKAIQVDKKGEESKINRDALFYGLFCTTEFLAAASFVILNYERLMPKSARSSATSRSGTSGGAGAIPPVGRHAAQLSDAEKGFGQRGTVCPSRTAQDLRELTLTHQRARLGGSKDSTRSSRSGSTDSSISGTSAAAGGVSEKRKKSGGIERASNIFHERFRRHSGGYSGTSDDDVPAPPALITDPKIMERYKNANPALRYKLATEIRRQREQANAERAQAQSDAEGGIHARANSITATTLPASQTTDGGRTRDVNDARSRFQHAVEARGYVARRPSLGMEEQQPSYSFPPRAANAQPVRVVVDGRRLSDPVSPRTVPPGYDTVEQLDSAPMDNGAGARGKTAAGGVGTKSATADKTSASPSMGDLFRKWCGNATKSPRAPQGPAPTGPKAAEEEGENEEQHFSSVSLSTPTAVQTVPAPTRSRLHVEVQIDSDAHSNANANSNESRSNASTRTSGSKPSTSIKRTRSTLDDDDNEQKQQQQQRHAGADLPPPSADMSSLHAFHLGEFTPTPRGLRAEGAKSTTTTTKSTSSRKSTSSSRTKRRSKDYGGAAVVRTHRHLRDSTLDD